MWDRLKITISYFNEVDDDPVSRKGIAESIIIDSPGIYPHMVNDMVIIYAIDHAL